MLTVRSPAPLGMVPTFGFGDRLGLATLGHLDAWRASGGTIQPVFAQHSLCELVHSGRKATDAMRDTLAALTLGNFTGNWGADADHLHTPEDINTAASAGFTTFTLDAAAFVDRSADHLPVKEVDQKFLALKDDLHWADDYRGSLDIPELPAAVFDRTELRRAALKYGRGIAHAVKLAAHADRIVSKRRETYEIEVTFADAGGAVTPLEHYLIADQCLKSNIRLASLGLRWSPGLEPAVDFRGDLRQFENELTAHAAVARKLGPYKLCLHHGSDKFRLYEIFARVTRGLFHVKTAGTSYLEGLRVAARHERRLFRRVIDFARQQFDRARGSQEVSARLDQVPQAAAIPDDVKLEQLYLDEPAGRQILHVTFGFVLADAALGPMLHDVLAAHPETHRQVLSRHLGRHLEFLNRGLGENNKPARPKRSQKPAADQAV